MAQFSTLEIIAIVLLSLIGFCLVLKVLKGVWRLYLAHALGFGVKWRPGENIWAVITGATDGIGLEYARQLAAKGYSIVLISRSEDKLKRVAQEIQAKYPNCKQIRTVTADFNQTDIYENIANAIDKLDEVDVLVNNVGTVFERPCEYFTLIPATMNDTYFNVNMRSCVKMIEIVLPKMVKQKRGIIINVSSIAGILPTPMFAVYSGTKAFMRFLSESLAIEYESKGIIIQTVLPGQVQTNMTKDFDRYFFEPTAEEYVSSAIKTVGIEGETVGHWKHRTMIVVLETFIALFGERFTPKLSFYATRDFRAKYYKKNNLKDTF